MADMRASARRDCALAIMAWVLRQTDAPYEQSLCMSCIRDGLGLLDVHVVHSLSHWWHSEHLPRFTFNAQNVREPIALAGIH